MEAFYAFLGRRLEEGANAITPEESVEEFRAYQDEVSHLQSKLTSSHEQFLQGEARELDTDALLGRVQARLANGEGAD